MKKGFIRFCVSVLLVLIIVCFVDWTIGEAMDRILPQISNQGDIGKTYYSLYEVDAPVLIVGSSRAAHHYVSSIIEDSLALRTYNVGRDGCFFSYNCCVINSILDRYNPKLIIWENGSDYLYSDINDPMESLYPYYGRNSWVTDTVKEDEPMKEYIRLNSRLYQYNSTIHRILIRYMGRHSFADNTIKGYVPLKPIEQKMSLEQMDIRPSLSKLSDTKIERFRSVLERARRKGTKVVVADSPMYKKYDCENMSSIKMRQLCNQYGAQFLDNSQLPYFFEHPELFNDATHLNNEGAKVYTQIFIGQLNDK